MGSKASKKQRQKKDAKKALAPQNSDSKCCQQENIATGGRAGTPPEAASDAPSEQTAKQIVDDSATTPGTVSTVERIVEEFVKMNPEFCMKDFDALMKNLTATPSTSSVDVEKSTSRASASQCGDPSLVLSLISAPEHAPNVEPPGGATISCETHPASNTGADEHVNPDAGKPKKRVKKNRKRGGVKKRAKNHANDLNSCDGQESPNPKAKIDSALSNRERFDKMLKDIISAASVSVAIPGIPTTGNPQNSSDISFLLEFRDHKRYHSLTLPIKLYPDDSFTGLSRLKTTLSRKPVPHQRSISELDQRGSETSVGAREQSANSGLLFDSVYLSSLRSKPTQVIHSDPSTSAGAVPDRSTDDSPSNPPQRPPHSEIPFFRFPDDGVAESNESNQQKSSNTTKVDIVGSESTSQTENDPKQSPSTTPKEMRDKGKSVPFSVGQMLPPRRCLGRGSIVESGKKVPRTECLRGTRMPTVQETVRDFEKALQWAFQEIAAKEKAKEELEGDEKSDFIDCSGERGVDSDADANKNDNIDNRGSDHDDDSAEDEGEPGSQQPQRDLECERGSPSNPPPPHNMAQRQAVSDHNDNESGSLAIWYENSEARHWRLRDTFQSRMNREGVEVIDPFIRRNPHLHLYQTTRITQRLGSIIPKLVVLRNPEMAALIKGLGQDVVLARERQAALRQVIDTLRKEKNEDTDVNDSITHSTSAEPENFSSVAPEEPLWGTLAEQLQQSCAFLSSARAELEGWNLKTTEQGSASAAQSDRKTGLLDLLCPASGGPQPLRTPPRALIKALAEQKTTDQGIRDKAGEGIKDTREDSHPSGRCCQPDPDGHSVESRSVSMVAGRTNDATVSTVPRRSRPNFANLTLLDPAPVPSRTQTLNPAPGRSARSDGPDPWTGANTTASLPYASSLTFRRYRRGQRSRYGMDGANEAPDQASELDDDCDDDYDIDAGGASPPRSLLVSRPHRCPPMKVVQKVEQSTRLFDEFVFSPIYSSIDTALLNSPSSLTPPPPSSLSTSSGVDPDSDPFDDAFAVDSTLAHQSEYYFLPPDGPCPTTPPQQIAIPRSDPPSCVGRTITNRLARYSIGSMDEWLVSTPGVDALPDPFVDTDPVIPSLPASSSSFSSSSSSSSSCCSCGQDNRPVPGLFASRRSCTGPPKPSSLPVSKMSRMANARKGATSGPDGPTRFNLKINRHVNHSHTANCSRSLHSPHSSLSPASLSPPSSSSSLAPSISTSELNPTTPQFQHQTAWEKFTLKYSPMAWSVPAALDDLDAAVAAEKKGRRWPGFDLVSGRMVQDEVGAGAVVSTAAGSTARPGVHRANTSRRRLPRGNFVNMKVNWINSTLNAK